MDLRRIAESLTAGPEVTAAANPAVASAIAELIKTAVTPLLEEFGPDFGHDAPALGVRGQSEGEMSFPVRPKLFDSENLNGTLLVKIKLDPPVQGSGKAIANTETTASFVVCYYFKTPRIPGSGKCMWDTAAGSAQISFDANGKPGLKDAGEVEDIATALEQLRDRVVDSPPEGAHSLSRDPQHRKEQAELNETARREKEEKAREKEQSERAKAQKEADSHTHGSVEAFVRYMDEQDEDEFGMADLQKLLNTMFPDNASRALAQGEIKRQLEAEGMVFNPKKRHLSFNMTRIAARVAAEEAKFTGLSEWEFVEGATQFTDNAIIETVVGVTDDGREFKGLITVYTEPDEMSESGRQSTGWDYKAISGPEPEDAEVVQEVLDAFDQHGV